MLKTVRGYRLVLFIVVSIPLVMLSVYGFNRRQPAHSPEHPGSAIQVVTSIHPLSSIVREVGGDNVDVLTLLPAGGSAHLHEIPPSTLGKVSDAELLIRVGGGLDDWAEQAFKVVAEECTLVRLVPALRELTSGCQEVDWSNPHLWLDPVLVSDLVVPFIADLLSDLRPGESGAFRTNAERFRSELTVLHEDLEELFGDIRGRGFIADHPAWSHFAHRYDLWQVGVLEETPGHECGPKQVSALVDAARLGSISVITTTKGHGAMLAEALADQVDATVLELDPIGGGPGGPRSYLDLIRHNAQILAEALSDGP